MAILGYCPSFHSAQLVRPSEINTTRTFADSFIYRRREILKWVPDMRVVTYAGGSEAKELIVSIYRKQRRPC